MSRRRRPGQIRLLEKQLRPEVIERCLEFVDVAIHQIIYHERLYPSVLFVPRQIYRQLVHHCVEKDIGAYITLCVSALRDLFSQQFVDLISVNLLSERRGVPLILRRYLIELHPVDDPCLRAIYDNTRDLIEQLDGIFARALQAIGQIQPLEKNNLKWTFQFRISPDGKSTSLEEILRKKSIYKEFPLVNEQKQSMCQSRISQIRSFHCERVHLQVMCEDDPHEQSHSTESIPSIEPLDHFPPVESKQSSDEDSPIYQDTEDEEDEF